MCWSRSLMLVVLCCRPLKLSGYPSASPIGLFAFIAKLRRHYSQVPWPLAESLFLISVSMQAMELKVAFDFRNWILDRKWFSSETQIPAFDTLFWCRTSYPFRISFFPKSRISNTSFPSLYGFLPPFSPSDLSYPLCFTLCRCVILHQRRCRLILSLVGIHSGDFFGDMFLLFLGFWLNFGLIVVGFVWFRLQRN